MRDSQPCELRRYKPAGTSYLYSTGRLAFLVVREMVRDADINDLG